MAGMADAFFVGVGDSLRFRATAHTEGLWSPGVQHAGPPAALLVRAVENTPSSINGPALVARLTTEILGPIPVGEVAVTARVVRPGRSVELLEAELAADGRPIMVARAWRIRLTTEELPGDLVAAEPGAAEPGGAEPGAAEPGAAEPVPPLPPDSTVFADPAMQSGYLAAMEWRFLAGGFEETGPARAWARQRIPLVAGEEPTPLQRLVTLADAGNGISRVLDFDTWWFINTELSIHLFRPPAGEWMYLAARTRLGPNGTAVAQAEFADRTGPVGLGAQSLLVGRR